jgi:hypothetical protein
MTKTSINRMSLEEIAAYLERRKQRDIQEKHQKALKAKKELGAYCQRKYGLTLQEIFTASDKAPEKKLYRNPDDGSIYSYSGRGKLPGWLKGPDGKPNKSFEVRAPGPRRGRRTNGRGRSVGFRGGRRRRAA